jgi:hypothetical protein
MKKIYRVWWYKMGEDAYGYPKTYKEEKFFSTLEKAENFAKEVDGRTEEVEVE